MDIWVTIKEKARLIDRKTNLALFLKSWHFDFSKYNLPENKAVETMIKECHAHYVSLVTKQYNAGINRTNRQYFSWLLNNAANVPKALIDELPNYIKTFSTRIPGERLNLSPFEESKLNEQIVAEAKMLKKQGKKPEYIYKFLAANSLEIFGHSLSYGQIEGKCKRRGALS